MFNNPANMLPTNLLPALNKTARVFFAIGIIGIGIQHFIYSAFRPVILPAWPQWMQLSILAYLVGTALIAAGIFILLSKKTKTVSLLLAGFLLICGVFIQC